MLKNICLLVDLAGAVSVSLENTFVFDQLLYIVLVLLQKDIFCRQQKQRPLTTKFY